MSDHKVNVKKFVEKKAAGIAGGRVEVFQIGDNPLWHAYVKVGRTTVKTYEVETDGYTGDVIHCAIADRR